MRSSMTQAFTSFLSRRHALWHFARRPQLAILVERDASAATHTPFSDDLLRAAHDDPAAAIARLGSQASGLTQEEAGRRLAQYGPNEIAREKPLPAWLRLWRCYLNPFNLLLTVLAFLSWFSADAKATIVIAVMVALSTLIRFVQESRSHDAAEGLRAMVRNTSLGRRSRPGDSLWRTSQRDMDVLVYTVFIEDSAALVGIAPAAIGIWLSHALATAWLDPAASVGIGLVLIASAALLAHKSVSLLLGASLDSDQIAVLRRIIAADPAVESVGHLLTMRLGPESVLLTAAVRFSKQRCQPSMCGNEQPVRRARHRFGLPKRSQRRRDDQQT